MAPLTGLTAICGLEAEAKLLRPLGIQVMVTAGDAARGQAAAENASAKGKGALLSFGICGRHRSRPRLGFAIAAARGQKRKRRGLSRR